MPTSRSRRSWWIATAAVLLAVAMFAAWVVVDDAPAPGTAAVSIPPSPTLRPSGEATPTPSRIAATAVRDGASYKADSIRDGCDLVSAQLIGELLPKAKKRKVPRISGKPGSGCSWTSTTSTVTRTLVLNADVYVDSEGEPYDPETMEQVISAVRRNATRTPVKETPGVAYGKVQDLRAGDGGGVIQPATSQWTHSFNQVTERVQRVYATVPVGNVLVRLEYRSSLREKGSRDTWPAPEGPSMNLVERVAGNLTLKGRTRPDPSATQTIDQPSDEAAGRELTENAIYRSGPLPTPTCSLPRRWPSGVASTERFYRSAVGCIDRTWQPILREAGLTASTPEVSVKGTIAWCRRPTACYDVQQRTLRFPAPPDPTYWKELHLLVQAAHEYGHHVQELAGIMDGRTKREVAARTQAGEDELSRRLELQAQCFAGAFLHGATKLGAIDRTNFGRYLASYRGKSHHDDQATHGSGRAISDWTKRGYQAGSPGACNTWEAPAAQVR
ncbi:neutral zinc metallopeptidase [Microtetraspora malaysiensis]|uniref:neutral zinc metallopeptidase n=1 Tax=Microtetraspora malaysiensis TaxID=161358 RepID=UPI003D8A7DF6